MVNVDLLASSCNNLLSVLIQLLEKAEITECEFKSHINTKVVFLTDHLESIADPDIKKESQQLLDRCDTLLNKKPLTNLACNTQV